MNIEISDAIREKLALKHGVTEVEVRQCFENREHKTLVELRTQHLTDPPSHWFLAETNRGRLLKIVFVPVDGRFYLKTAFEPSDKAISYYYKSLGLG